MDAIAINISDWEVPCEVRKVDRRHHASDQTDMLRAAYLSAERALYAQPNIDLLWARVKWPITTDASVVISKPEPECLEARFQRYADKWDRDTSFMSATPMRVMHESYQSIMSMGPDVVPILLRDLQKSRRHWFWALRHLTGENPVPESAKGQTDKMIAAWVDWGKSKGKI